MFANQFDHGQSKCMQQNVIQMVYGVIGLCSQIIGANSMKTLKIDIDMAKIGLAHSTVYRI